MVIRGITRDLMAANPYLEPSDFLRISAEPLAYTHALRCAPRVVFIGTEMKLSKISEAIRKAYDVWVVDQAYPFQKTDAAVLCPPLANLEMRDSLHVVFKQLGANMVVVVPRDRTPASVYAWFLDAGNAEGEGGSGGMSAASPPMIEQPRASRRVDTPPPSAGQTGARKRGRPRKLTRIDGPLRGGSSASSCSESSSVGSAVEAAAAAKAGRALRGALKTATARKPSRGKAPKHRVPSAVIEDDDEDEEDEDDEAARADGDAETSASDEDFDVDRPLCAESQTEAQHDDFAANESAQHEQAGMAPPQGSAGPNESATRDDDTESGDSSVDMEL